MASIRPAKKPRRDGRMYWSVLYRLDGGQRSTSFYSEDEAQRFKALIDAVGPAKALEAIGQQRPSPRQAITVTEWLNQHIDHLTGVEQYTIDKYRGYVRNDIADTIGRIPLDKLTEHDIATWVKRLASTNSRRGRPRSAKTIQNIHGFLSGALAAAVPKHIPANPASGRRLPKGTGDTVELTDRMLSRDEFAVLQQSFTDRWHPLLEFLVASGCRWGEAAALKPDDVDQDAGTIRISRAWKYSSNGYHIGPPKTKRSKRVINIDKSVLEKLDYTQAWLFTNTRGGPLRYYTFKANVWNPAALKSGLQPVPTPHDLRHTCASWMLNAGVPIPVVSRHLGHESIQVTVDIYGDLDRTVAAAAATIMGQILATEPQKAIVPANAACGPQHPG